jgi:AcrR family transcriptional regulator
MPYPAGHRDRIRATIVESARRLFNRCGFDAVSIDEIMADAGLTRGAFYTYFESKSELYTHVLSCFFTDPNWKNRWKGVEVDMQSPGAAAQIVRAYLSRQHFEDVENSCPMVALPCDVARSGDAVKAAFESVVQAMVGVLSGEIEGTPKQRQDRAMAVAALCIGGMVVARSMSDERFATRLREAAANAALAIGGWRDPAALTPKRRP